MGNLTYLWWRTTKGTITRHGGAPPQFATDWFE
jgi:hypothetical protein